MAARPKPFLEKSLSLQPLIIIPPPPPPGWFLLLLNSNKHSNPLLQKEKVLKSLRLLTKRILTDVVSAQTNRLQAHPNANLPEKSTIANTLWKNVLILLEKLSKRMASKTSKNFREDAQVLKETGTKEDRPFTYLLVYSFYAQFWNNFSKLSSKIT